MRTKNITIQGGVQSKTLEYNSKESTQIIQHTDTEPEVENDINEKKYFSLGSNNQKPKKINENNKKNVFENFIDLIPDFEYDQKQIRKNQQKTKEKVYMTFRESNENKFLNYYEAFFYVAKICKMNDQRFTKENCKKYLKDCYIVDFEKDGFAPISSHLSPKNLKKYFSSVQRELKYL